MQCLFVGAGDVASQYAAGLTASPVDVVGVCDLDRARAERLAEQVGAVAYTDLTTALAETTAVAVVNLTDHQAHADVTEQSLRAGYHVHSEKPLAVDAWRARNLLALASDRGLALGCAPTNHRSVAQRQAAGVLADGRTGTIREGYAHAHVGRVTEWHDDPEAFLAVGPLYDGAVYPLTLLVAWFGPVETVRTADARSPWPDRAEDDPERASHVTATLSFAGPTVQLTASFYAPHRSREFYGLELHGDDGSLYLDDAGALTATDDSVQYGGLGRSYTSMPPQTPDRERRHLAGVERLARHRHRERPPLADARRSAHVVAVCTAIERAAASGGPVTVEDCGATAVDPVPPVVRPPSPLSEGTVQPGDGRAALRLPSIGFGCSRYRDGEYVDRTDSIARALDAGYRLLDSAELYGNEYRIGDLLASPGTPDRERLFLIGKVWNTNHEHVAAACRGSLSELGIDAFDCYTLHWPTAWKHRGPLDRLAEKPVAEQERLTFPERDGEPATVDVSLTETWRRMESLVDEGLTRTLGLCNVSVEQLDAVCEGARVPPALVQVESHPYRPRSELVAECHDRGIRVVAHSPLSAPGLLEEPVLAAVGDDHDLSPAQVTLAWQITRGVVPIPASNDPEHVVANAAAAGRRLPPDAITRIEALADAEFGR
ncbi:aldo/keto reductase [Halomicrobium sp. HM KBTZ05]|uniref:aldo/keto reductase n=1 Tax=Halomicrobium sp. HM KBTZ05 TaxID=3242663 RepID=UPI003557E9D6